MITKQVSSYIVFGTQLRFLMDCDVGWEVHKPDWINDNLEWFFNNLENAGLKVTQRASSELLEVKNRLSATPAGYTLTQDDVRELRKAVGDLRKTLYAETQGQIVYVVTEKRMDVEKLLNDASKLFAPGVFETLGDVARYDFNEAGKCIAFQRPTAGAFHILRATEDTLRLYYKNKVRRNRIRSEMWGDIVTDLRTRRNSPPKTLLDNLDNIRVNFRNPTQHPEKVYDIEEVQDLFSLCIDVVNRMSGI